MITIVDPVSTGRDLSASFVERGVVPLHLYRRRHEQAYAEDTHPHTLLVDDPREALGDLAARRATAVVAGSEDGVDAANDLSHALGLPHHLAATAPARRDRVAMYRALHAAGVPAVRAVLLAHRREVDAVLGRFDRFPLVVALRDPAGGDVAVLCHDPGEVRSAVAALAAPDRPVLLREHLDGPLVAVDTVSAGGRHLLAGLYDLRVDRVGGRPLVRDTVLRKRPGSVHAAVAAHVADCLDVLGVREGAAHGEVCVTPAGPRLLELHARVTDASQDPGLHRPALGYSHADLTAERFVDPAAFALRFADPYRPDAALATVALHVPVAGVVTARPGLAALEALPGFVRAERLPRVGDAVAGPPTGTGHAGTAYLRHPDETVLRRSLDRLHALEDRGELYSLTPTPSRTCG